MITVESNMEYEESKGHKGELRSLQGLRGLLSKQPEADTQPAAPAEHTAEETKDAPVDEQSTPKEKDQANSE